MNITSTTTTLIHIELTEAEARAALAEPQALQAELRSALAPIAARRQTRRSITLSPKARAPKLGRHNGPRPKSPCPKCGRELTAQGLGKHLKVCTGAGANL